MKYIFLDTNIFIHFQLYEQIPWQEIVGDEYKLIIAPIVLDELDKHKTNPNKKIAGRVKNILPKIEKEQTNIDSIVDVYLSTPKDDTFNKFNLSKGQQDHALLAAMLEFGELHGLNSIIFISHDTGPRIRARQLGISVIGLDEKYLLPEEDSPEEKELKTLRKENTEFKNSLPKLELTFNHGETFKQIELNPLFRSEDNYLEKELEDIKEKYYPFIVENTEENDAYVSTHIALENLMNTQRRINSMFGISQPTIEQKKEYNQKLQKFHAEYIKIATEKYKWEEILSNAVFLNLDVSNNGTAPANDIDVFLTFPNSVKVLLYDNFPKFEKPKPPYKPKHAGDIDMSGIGVNFMFNPPAIEYMYIIDKSFVKNSFKHQNVEHSDNGNTIIQYKYPNSLKHNLHFPLEPIWVVCKKSFKIKYKLLVSNYPKQIEGELNINVIVKKE